MSKKNHRSCQPPTGCVSNSILNIAIIGAGGIGSAFAHKLARADHKLTVIARPDSARHQQLQRDQGIVDKDEVKVAMQVADRLATLLWCVSRIKSFRKLLATGKNEYRSLVDEVIAEAAQAKVTLPNEIAALFAVKP
jgi:predicted dinucleotide-binding enzyme